MPQNHGIQVKQNGVKIKNRAQPHQEKQEHNADQSRSSDDRGCSQH